MLPSLTLMDCDGTPHDLRDLCGSDAAWIFEFAAWCPPCRSFARNMNARLADYADEDLAVYLVISADANFGAPDAADCRAIREQYGLQIPVLYDPNGDFQRVFGVPDNDVHVVLDGDGTITLKEHYASEAEVYDAIDAALAD
ncbi:MAG: TlpA family protein disulfide reductase [Myxococcales bacterium]|nr:TlpA family protein disulfide reductase [Myxococcales bacterium]